MDEQQAERARVIAVATQREEFVTLEDGFVYYWPWRKPHYWTGALSAHVLRWIADELDARNAQWAADMEKHCRG